ncbi:cell division cycle-associated protein 4 isoform X1 [Salmo salar]|uniref:Cell division cycle-associated protein 4 isoform X1 n=2 Tax=Salmo salar TaxID=8030 RepID=A0A1S3NQ73_SALSA|nr:cell division cycle-associated protein 4 isoform X1 [Salmo salar]|eukprot:XP_014017572.1 PREDICTED: SERTA domain-containing protein 3 isoform X1 [Salmo salar]
MNSCTRQILIKFCLLHLANYVTSRRMMMISKGQKRKVDDVVGGMRSGTWESQRQSVLGITLFKYHRGQELMEPSLRRSVLIANTLRHIHLENKPPYGLVNLAGPVPPMVPSKPCSHRESGLGVVNSASGVEDKKDVWMSSESDFSLSGAVSSILKELDLTVDGGLGPQAPQRTPFRSIENLPGDLGLKQSSEGCRTSEGVAFGSVEEVMCSSYLQDGKLDELFHDIDTSVFDKEMGVRALSAAASDELLKYLPSLSSVPSASPSLFSLNQSFRDLNELEHIMEILVES